MPARPGVGDVEDVAQAGRVAGDVDEGNAAAAVPDIAAHAPVPDAVLRAGRRVGPLGEDHELFAVRVFIEPRGGAQKRRVLLVAAGDLLRRPVGKLRIRLYCCRHQKAFLLSIME